MATGRRPHACDLALPAGFQLPRGCPLAALQPRNAVPGGGEEMFSFLGCMAASVSVLYVSTVLGRAGSLPSSSAALSLVTPERAGLRCQATLTLAVYLYFPGGIIAT